MLVVVATQEERKAETRQRLLDAAALLFADRGIDAVSIDAVADAADRTSGAVYAHFGGKDGLLVALLDDLVDDMAAVMQRRADAERRRRDDTQLAALWRTFSDPPPGPGRGVDAARARVLALRRPPRATPADGWPAATPWPAQTAAAAMVEHAEQGEAELPAPPDQVATLLVALLIGLEMQSRIDPEAVSDATAVTGLRALTGFGARPDRSPPEP